MVATFGPVRQLGYVVPDLDRAVRHWVSHLGVGPFYVIADQPLKEFTYRGVPSEPSCRIALAQSGTVQIELIEQRNEAPSAFLQFTEAQPGGLQHLGFWTVDFDRDVQRARELGMTELQRGQSGSGAPDERFIYFTHDEGHLGTVVELSEVVGRKGALFRAVQEAASDWDGSDPVRSMEDLVFA